VERKAQQGVAAQERARAEHCGRAEGRECETGGDVDGLARLGHRDDVARVEEGGGEGQRRAAHVVDPSARNAQQSEGAEQREPGAGHEAGLQAFPPHEHGVEPDVDGRHVHEQCGGGDRGEGDRGLPEAEVGSEAQPSQQGEASAASTPLDPGARRQDPDREPDAGERHAVEAHDDGRCRIRQPYEDARGSDAEDGERKQDGGGTRQRYSPRPRLQLREG
jgi:hypothetical protein